MLQLHTVWSNPPPQYLFPAVDFDVQMMTKNLLSDPPGDDYFTAGDAVDFTTR